MVTTHPAEMPQNRNVLGLRRRHGEPAYHPLSADEATSDNVSLLTTDRVLVSKLPDEKAPLLLEHLNRQTLAMVVIKPPIMDEVDPLGVWWSLGGSIRCPQRTEFRLEKLSDCLDGTKPFATYPIFSRHVNISVMKDTKRGTVTAQVYEKPTQVAGSANGRPFSEYDKAKLSDLLGTFVTFWSRHNPVELCAMGKTHVSLFATMDPRIEEAANRPEPPPKPIFYLSERPPEKHDKE